MPEPLDKVICIQGPTASGKSALAEALAQRLDGEIVSADSMQVYRGMDIGTAKVAPKQRHVAYHCIDLVDPGTPYSAALYQRDARAAIDDIAKRKRRAIICGGTGLYVRAAIDDMEFAPGRAESPARAKYGALAEELGSQGLHDLLKEKDPQSAALIHPHNVRRTIRAFEMLEAGDSYARRKASFKSMQACIPTVKLALNLNRSLLYERIDARVDAMVQSGLVEEVERLLGAGFRAGLTAPQAIGYKELVAYLDGELTLDEALVQIKQATRRYAKRQLSWLRSDLEIRWLPADDGITDTLIAEALDVIERACLT